MNELLRSEYFVYSVYKEILKIDLRYVIKSEYTLE